MALLEEHRLVTLTGPGGIGKTTLARSVLAQSGGADTWFIDLWPVEREPEVPHAVAAGLVLVVTEAEDAETAMLAYLRARPALLVLDNVEHLPGLGRRVHEWLAEAADLRILATGRMPLGVPGEQEFPVSGIALPRGDTPDEVEASPAGRLFLDTARRLGALEVVDAATAGDLAVLLRRLDGMPLAIELAAGRSRVLTPSGLLRRLDDPTVVAAGSTHDGDARHASLDRVLAMTLDLLPGPQRRLLAALSVCPGSFDMEVAGALAPDMPIVPAMDLLLAAGLARRDGDIAGETRFGLLETVRTRMARELTPADRAVTAERHAGAVLSMAERAVPEWISDERRAVARFVAEDDNIAAAVEWATEHDAALGLRLLAAFDRRAQGGVQLERSVRWHRTLLAAARPDDPLRLIVTSSLLRLLTRYAGPREALTLESEVLAEIDSQPRPVRRGIYLRLAHAYYALGDARATARFSKLASAAADDPDDAAALRLDGEAQLAWVVDQDAEQSASLYRLAAAADARAGRVTNRAIELFKAALAELRAGRPASAASAAREAVGLSPPGNGRAFAGSIHVFALAELGDIGSARESLAAAWHEVEQEARIDRIEVLEAAVAMIAAEGRLAAAITALAVADRDRPATGWQRDPHIAFLLDRWRQRAVRSLGSMQVSLAAGDAATRTIEDVMADTFRSPERPLIVYGASMVERLTPREVEVLALVADGRSDGEIAAELFISPKTASVHVANIKGKLGLDSRLQVALHAREIGIFGGPEPAVH